MERTAILSPCKQYRYRLGRVWNTAPKRPQILPWIMANPSTVDHATDDPAVQTLIKISREWGFDGLSVFNLLPIRTSDPCEAHKWKMTHPDFLVREEIKRQIGHLQNGTLQRELIMCAWGDHGGFITDDMECFLRSLSRRGLLFCLGKNQDGSPRHPLEREKNRLSSPYPLEVF